MEREQIDKEYADLCLKYGDISQKILHLESQEQIQLQALESQKEAYEQAYLQARLPLRKELNQIETRWKELKALLDDLQKTDMQPQTSDTLG